ncbi:plasmid partition protein ParG [Scytonema hofmannii]|nr:plasmid partition protein ParG [Scytonema hofmannii]
MTKEIHINISDDLKKQFHATCVMQGKKMNQVVVELIHQWLRTNEISQTNSEIGKKLPPKSC